MKPPKSQAETLALQALSAFSKVALQTIAKRGAERIGQTLASGVFCDAVATKVYHSEFPGGEWVKLSDVEKDRRREQVRWHVTAITSLVGPL